MMPTVRKTAGQLEAEAREALRLGAETLGPLEKLVRRLRAGRAPADPDRVRAEALLADVKARRERIERHLAAISAAGVPEDTLLELDVESETGGLAPGEADRLEALGADLTSPTGRYGKQTPP